MRWVLVPLLVVAMLSTVACTGTARTEPGTDGGPPPPGVDGGPPPPGVDGGPPPPGIDGGPPPPGTDGGGPPPPIDAGPCGATTLADALTVTPVAGTSRGTGEAFAAARGGGAVLAYTAGDGVHLTPIDGAGARMGDDVVVSGSRAYGLAVSDDDTWAVLVARGSDALYLVGVRPDGSERFATKVLGEVDHGVTDNEWFGTGIRAGRLAFTGSEFGSEFAAYYTVNRLWSDGIAHYGDQLTLYGTDGTVSRQVWGWGCSHSMEVRITHNGTGLGPLCASDCFPEPGGIFFNHRTFLYSDSEADCRGGHGTSLGGIAPASDGFHTVFVVGDDRPSKDVALVHVGNDRSVGEVTWVSDASGDETAPNVARFGADLVVGWVQGGDSMLRLIGASGTPLAAAEPVPAAALGSASDFFVLDGGAVGWAINGSDGLSFARLRDCR